MPSLGAVSMSRQSMIDGSPFDVGHRSSTNPAEPKHDGAKLFTQFLHIRLAQYAVSAYKERVRQSSLTAEEKAMSYETASLILQALSVMIGVAALIIALR